MIARVMKRLKLIRSAETIRSPSALRVFESSELRMVLIPMKINPKIKKILRMSRMMTQSACTPNPMPAS